ncbi:MAG TPA: glycoside hydrolase family 2 TIM barrel-domain containing protein [Caldisericia bacterium]|nr:MAG: Beta-galactosidase [bacterium ADurb.Bin132]HNY61853.1 glycoside hydrolase family 2 TIM barrel-domain containing protein [Caldisericia bacterium]HOC79332.1 glycoside hydrolase family 2 TIM barrel-domain containing protein [Caldisericia bacterium]HOG70911.1 glycoside hydrolase family 2 TIM barrel-domain containing protein [Caldisericia bacterium]HPA66142.1 glycoside hydrolase family 2 TIM barrel-domain containing protein [Caldisericia bacterium]
MNKFVTLILCFAMVLQFSQGTARNAEPKRDPVFYEWVTSTQKELSLKNLPKAGFKPFFFPHTTNTAIASYYRGKFDWDGTGTIRIKFGAVNFFCKLWVNSKEAGSHLGGYLPFEFDITSFLKKGKNELVLGAQGILGIVSEIGAKDPRAMKENSVTLPIGSAFMIGGMWLPSSIKKLPPVFVEKVLIDTSVRQKTLKARVRLGGIVEGKKGLSLSLWVEDMQGAKLFALGNKNVDAGKEIPLQEFKASWNNPKLWSPENPNLYFLVSVLSQNGKEIHRDKTRFGFREFWVQGGNFFLNGKKIHLRATSRHLFSQRWADIDMEETAKQVISKAKAFNSNILRLHANPYPEAFLEEADTQGIMIVDESAAWTFGSAYALENELFWKTLYRQWDDHIKRDYNHPSFVLASAENELMLTGGVKRKNIQENLQKLGKYIRESSGRPVMFEGDYDPNGSADVINLHYPWEPSSHFTYPNDAYFLDGSFSTDIYPAKEIKWDRSKPMYIGECLWMPGPFHEYAVTGGDYTYQDLKKGYYESKKELFADYIQAFRELEVSAFCPWNPFEDENEKTISASQLTELQSVVSNYYKPVRFFIRQKDDWHYAGSKVFRTVTIQNWSEQPKNLKLAWSFGKGVDSSKSGELSFRLDPDETKTITITLELPDGLVFGKQGSWGDIPLKMALSDGNIPVHEEEHQIHSYSMPSKQPAKFALLGGSDQLSKDLSNSRLFHNRAQKVDEITDGIAIIAPNFLKQQTLDGSNNTFQALEKKGIKYIVLGPQPEGSIPYCSIVPAEREIEKGKTQSFRFTHISFSKDMGPFKKDSLIKCFAGDNIIASGVLKPYSDAPCVPFASAGTGNGLVCVGFEVEQKGFVTCIELASKISTEPRCHEILCSMLGYLSEDRQSLQAQLVALSDKSSSYLSSLGFTTTKNSATNGVLYVGEADTITLKNIEKLGTIKAILFDRKGFASLPKQDGVEIKTAQAKPEPAVDLQGMKELDGVTRFSFIEATGFVYDKWRKNFAPLGKTVIEKLALPKNAKLTWGVKGYFCKVEDLYPQTVFINMTDWDKGPSNMPLSLLLQNLGCKKTFNADRVEIPLSSLKLEGGARYGQEKIAFLSNGKAKFQAKLEPGVKFQLNLALYQQKAGNENAKLSILLSGVKIGSIEVKSTTEQLYRLEMVAPSGDCEVALVFENDYYKPPQDRNLFLGRLFLTRLTP